MSKLYTLACAALEFAEANHQPDDPRPTQKLRAAALKYAESFAADCEADMSPPAQDGDFTDDLARETN